MLVHDPGRGVWTPIERCKVCGAKYYRSYDARGRTAKYTIDDDFSPTREVHVCAGRAGSSPRSGVPAPAVASQTSALASLPDGSDDASA